MAPLCHVRLPHLGDEYEPLDFLGSGSYGAVYKAVDRGTGEVVAVKQQEVPEQLECGGGLPPHILREVMALRKVSHRNVVELKRAHLETPGIYVFVFEYVERDLFAVLRELAKAGELMPLATLREYAQELLAGLHACHSQLVMHRDLKPQNILIGERGLKIADFGLARDCIPEVDRPYTAEVVTLWYRAPEILMRHRHYGEGIDMWSAGCIIGEMGVGRPLFPGDSDIGTTFKIMQLLGTPTEEVWPGCSQLPHMKPTFPKWPPTNFEPLRLLRPELGDAGINLLRSLLQYSARARATAREAKGADFFSTMAGGAVH